MFIQNNSKKSSSFKGLCEFFTNWVKRTTRLVVIELRNYRVSQIKIDYYISFYFIPFLTISDLWKLEYTLWYFDILSSVIILLTLGCPIRFAFFLVCIEMHQYLHLINIPLQFYLCIEFHFIYIWTLHDTAKRNL